MANEDRTFSPGPAEANRSAQQQGGGVGRREIDLQGVPDTTAQAADAGDNPEADWGEADEEAIAGETHGRRAEGVEEVRGQGPQTRERNKEINSGGL